jgi:hypothetical protein
MARAWLVPGARKRAARRPGIGWRSQDASRPVSASQPGAAA